MLSTVVPIRTHWWRLILLLVGLGGLLLGPGHSAAQQTVTLEAYLTAIAQYRSQVLRAGDNAQQCRETMTAVASALTAITAVQFPDGSVMPVNHQGATQALQAQPCNLVRADQYLSGLCPNQLCTVSRPLPPLRPATNSQSDGSLAGAAGGTSGDAAAAGTSPADTPPADLPLETAPVAETDPPADQNGTGEAGEIPATMEAQVAATAAGETEATGDGQAEAGEEQTEAVNEGQSDQAEVLPGAEATGEGDAAPPSLVTPGAENELPTPTAVPNPPVSTAIPNTPDSIVPNNRWLLLAVIVVVALGLIGTAVALLLGQNEDEEPVEKEASAVITAVSEGRQLVETGDYREAARRLFLAMLLALDEKGFLRFDRNRTNLELLQQEPLHQSLIPSLTPIIATYERVWYGLEPLPVAEYEQLASKIKTIRDWQMGT
ncbi:MAG: DUF4129 domain-containing protein [Anaerolineae bacterium]|nr:DUF4129 domain-containing protein [Anaerolineae bacterium]